MSLTNNTEELILMALDVTDEAMACFAHIIKDCIAKNRRPDLCGQFRECKLCQCAQDFAIEHTKLYPKDKKEIRDVINKI